ncbi:hypothetical protein [Streptomyces sp. Rer75]|uniref:MmyB family transcriptional regulator n=1 Tax=Streptomyces sp. Rer75 TaxID=2750011 RepID=UPI00211E7389|nr:hypothetical protein [Streptomyces sp. Rer75]
MDKQEMAAVGQPRGAAARHPDDPGIRAFVAELVDGSEDFARVWASHEVPVARHLRKVMRHPVVGSLTLHCDILIVPDEDQHVVIYTADPGPTATRRRRRCGCGRSWGRSAWTS